MFLLRTRDSADAIPEPIDLLGGTVRTHRLSVFAPSSPVADRVLDDMVHDAGRRVVDTAGFPDLGLFLYLCLMPSCESYDFAEELLVDLAEHVPAESGEERVEESKTVSPLAELGAELLFFVVDGPEDLATKVEAVDQTFDSFGCGRSHA